MTLNINTHAKTIKNLNKGNNMKCNEESERRIKDSSISFLTQNTRAMNIFGSMTSTK